MRYLKLYEDFESGKFSFEDIRKAMKEDRGIFTSLVKDVPKNDPKKALKIVDIDEESGEVSVLYDNDIRYIDISDIEKIEN